MVFVSAETAQMLARNVNYEVPALKKQIAKCQQIQKVIIFVFITHMHVHIEGTMSVTIKLPVFSG